MDIDLESQIGSTPYKWSDALCLRKTGVVAVIDEKQKFCIEKIAVGLEAVQKILGCQIVITSWFRPVDYNLMIGGSKTSPHCSGMAVDFIPSGMSADDARAILVPHLDSLKIRVENLPASSWVHIDCRSPNDGVTRFFKP